MYSKRNYSVKWKGHEVQNPVARKLIGVLCFAFAVIAIPLVFALLVFIIPLSLPWHFLLKLFGHRGFTKYENGKMTYNVPWWGVLLALIPIALLVIL